MQGSADTVAEATAVDLAIAYSKYVLDFIDYKVCNHCNMCCYQCNFFSQLTDATIGTHQLHQ